MTDKDRVVVVGAGPSGAALALALARADVPVSVVTAPRRHAAFEGLSSRAVEMLRGLGLARAAACAGEPRSRLANWDGRSSRHNSEHLVDRRAFDDMLVADLRDAGVAVVEGRVASVTETADGWEVRTEAEAVSARYLVEARGRAAPRSDEPGMSGPATIALSRVLRHSAPGAAGTEIAPFADGWAWRGCLGQGTTIVQFVVSGETVPGRQDLDGFYDQLLNTMPEGSDWRPEGCVAQGEVIARNCTSILREGLAGRTHLRIGDAACALDPLSGQGIFLALAGAQTAAAVVNTCLTAPPDEAADAVEFYRRRCREMFLEKVRLGRDFYRQERRWGERGFWSDRSSWPEGSPVAADDAAELIEGLVIDHGRVRRRMVYRTADHPMGVWRVADVPLAELRQTIDDSGRPREADWPALEQRFGVDRTALDTAVAWLRQRKVVGASGEAAP